MSQQGAGTKRGRASAQKQFGAAPGRAAARLGRVVENALSAVDLSLPQYRMLAFLDEAGSEAASALAGKMGVSRPSITALVDGLVARGMVERSPHPSDRRRVTHALTDCGRSALVAADLAVTERMIELAEWITEPGQRELAQRGLLIWMEALNAQRDARWAQE